MPKNRFLPFLLLLFTLSTSLGLRLWGIHWGLPTQDRFTTLYVDEYTPLWVLHKMNPSHGDFNPHYSHNPTFFYYQVGAALAISQKLGYLTLNGEKSYYLDHPEEYAKLYLIGRLLCVAYGVAVTLVLFFLGEKISKGNAWAGLGVAFLHAVLPISVIQSHVIDTSIPASFWLAVTFLLLLQFKASHRLSWLWWGALCAGLSCSTKYTTLPVVPLVAYAAWESQRSLKFTAVALLLLGLGFVAGTPYMLLDVSNMITGFLEMFRSAAGTQSATSFARLWYPLAHYEYGVGIPLTFLCGVGLLLAGARARFAATLSVLFLAPFLFLLARSALHVSRYLNETLPFLLPFAALPFLVTNQLRGGGFLRVLLGLLCLWKVPYTLAVTRSLSSERDPRDQASDWIRANVPNGTNMGLEKEANFMMPAHLYMQYWKGNRHPVERATPPDVTFSVWDANGSRWNPQPPDYWVETNLFSRRVYKNIRDEAAQTQDREGMRKGYQPVIRFERTIRCGPIRYSPPAVPGSDWQILLPELTIYAPG